MGDPKEQAISLINKSSVIGLAIPEKPTLDDTVSLFALSRTLAKLNKTTGLISSGQFEPLIYEILPAEEILKIQTPLLSDFIVEVNQKDSPIKELSYEHSDLSLKIVLKPKTGPIKNRGVSLYPQNGAHELVITLGIKQLEDLGRCLEQSPDFFEKPLITIGVENNNEFLAEVTLNGKNSVAETTADFILELAPQTLDDLSATALMAGMIGKTKNIILVSKLAQRGARKDEITQKLQKAKLLKLLRLWGRSSTRLRLDEKHKIMWSVITADDFLKTETSPIEAVPFVLEQAKKYLSLPEKFVLLWQSPEDKMIRAVFCENTKATNETFGPFQDFLSAEEAVRQLLMKQLSG